MPRCLITSGPTREYLDPIRYLSNGSSGRMGAALAEALLAIGWDVTIVSGPVPTAYPPAATVVPVVSTDEMRAAAEGVWPACDGLFAAAAPCDFRPRRVASTKLKKTGAGLTLDLEETPDVVAGLIRVRRPRQWVVAFALETHQGRHHALQKLRVKRCDWIVLNAAEAINADRTEVEMIDRGGATVYHRHGPKAEVAAGLVGIATKGPSGGDGGG